MRIFAIGDVQGCYDALRRLLDLCEFDPRRDQVWFAGDLVNRGEKSLQVLKFVRRLGDSAVCVLGNHDMHLLALAAGRVRNARELRSLAPVLAAKKADDLIDWLRHQPLVHRDKAAGWTMVHAGLPPQWTVKRAQKCAAELQSALQADDWGKTVIALRRVSPVRWSKELKGLPRLRYISNALTRMRYVTSKGGLDTNCKTHPRKAPRGLVPWFDVPQARWRGERIVFGHWSTLGLMQRPDLMALDTGCVWGGHLTAVRLDKRKKPRQVSCCGAAAPG